VYCKVKREIVSVKVKRMQFYSRLNSALNGVAGTFTSRLLFVWG